jgi:hypothetical protein
MIAKLEIEQNLPNSENQKKNHQQMALEARKKHLEYMKLQS